MVDERHDELEEGVDEPGDVDDEREPEAFWVVVLEDVEDLGRGGVCQSEGVI